MSWKRWQQNLFSKKNNLQLQHSSATLDTTEQEACIQHPMLGQSTQMYTGSTIPGLYGRNHLSRFQAWLRDRNSLGGWPQERVIMGSVTHSSISYYHQMPSWRWKPWQEEVMGWMRANNKLKLNPDKVEILLVGPNWPLGSGIYIDARWDCTFSEGLCLQFDVPTGSSTAPGMSRWHWWSRVSTSSLGWHSSCIPFWGWRILPKLSHIHAQLLWYVLQGAVSENSMETSSGAKCSTLYVDWGGLDRSHHFHFTGKQWLPVSFWVQFMTHKSYTDRDQGIWCLKVHFLHCFPI